MADVIHKISVRIKSKNPENLPTWIEDEPPGTLAVREYIVKKSDTRHRASYIRWAIEQEADIIRDTLEITHEVIK